MTPERLQEIREWIERKARVCQDWQVPYGTTIRTVVELLAHIDAQSEDIAALRRGQGRAPAPAGPGDGAYHETHPIPDSTGEAA